MSAQVSPPPPTIPSSNVDRPTIAAALALADSLFPMPKAVMNARQAIASGGSAERIAAILAQDQIAAATVVRLANSPAFRGLSTIRDLPQAVTRVGNKQLDQCLLALIALPTGQQNPTVSQLAKRIITTGACCRVLATYQVSVEVGPVVMIGLLMDIGQVLLAHGWEDAYRSQVMDRPVEAARISDATDAEREWLGFDHVDVAVALMQKWNVDKDTVDGIRFSHDLIGAMADGGPLATITSAVTGLASRIARVLHQEGPDAWIADDAILGSNENAVLTLEQERIADILEETRREAFQLGAVFGR